MKIEAFSVFFVLALGVVYMSTPRGIRNNNPLNLRESSSGGDNWQGEHALNLDADFEEFSKPVYGIRAGAKVLLNYQRLHGLNTVTQIISRFAPATENNTQSYINHVADYMDVAAGELINLENPETLAKLITVIIKHENGINPYSRETISNGVHLAMA